MSGKSTFRSEGKGGEGELTEEEFGMPREVNKSEGGKHEKKGTLSGVLNRFRGKFCIGPHSAGPDL
jgi:hypothetical protein